MNAGMQGENKCPCALRKGSVEGRHAIASANLQRDGGGVVFYETRTKSGVTRCDQFEPVTELSPYGLQSPIQVSPLGAFA
jgi:hypothetical protein